MEIKENKRKIRKRIRAAVIAVAVLAGLCFGTRWFLKRTGVIYPKGVYQPISLCEEAYTGTDTNPDPMLDTSGNYVQTRILPPEGYSRTDVKEDGFQDFLRRIRLKPAGTPVKAYNGEVITDGNETVYDFDLGGGDLQQCADSFIRVIAEYYYQTGQEQKISFHLTNGLEVKYTDWRAGNRLVAFGNYASMWKLSADTNNYDSFRAYLHAVMRYAGTKSLDAESSAIQLDKLQAGDLLLHGGAPGHVVMVVDVAENQEGERCYLLAGGAMPAQDFHIVGNPKHPKDLWFYQSDLEGDVIQVDGYTFNGTVLKRWNNGIV